MKNTLNYSVYDQRWIAINLIFIKTRFIMKTVQNSNASFVQQFRDSAPYIHAHRNKTFVILLTGAALTADLDHLVSDITLMSSLGVKLVLVLGARPQIDAELKNAGIVCEYFEDLRITERDVLQTIIAVNGKLRVELESRFSLGLLNSPMFNAHIQLISGNFVTAQPLGILKGCDLKHTGKVRNINHQSIGNLLDQQHLVLMPHLGYSLSGEVYNLSAEDVAVRTASALNADKLIVVGHTNLANNLSHSSGDKKSDQLSPQDCDEILKQHKKNELGYRELHALSSAAHAGIDRCHLVDYLQDGAILSELYTRDGQGILVSQDHYDELRGAKLSDVAGILELLKPLEQQGIVRPRSQEIVENEIEHYTVIERDGMVIGAASLYVYAEDKTAEMASVVVHPDYRKKDLKKGHAGGRGNQLLQAIEQQAKTLHLDSIFVLTTQTSHWFIERGFVDAGIDALPNAKKDIYDGRRNSKVLVKPLK
jgi:amino-acid N-acetyltransferase